MAFCITHQRFFHAEIEDCPDCEEVCRKCPHDGTRNRGLFNTTKYLGMTGDWECCDLCGGLVPVREPVENQKET